MQDLSFHLFRNDDVVSLNRIDGVIDEIDVSIWNTALGHLASSIDYNLRGDNIRNSAHWETRFHTLRGQFINFTPHANEYLDAENHSEYLEVTNDDQIPLSRNAGDPTDRNYEPMRVEMSTLGPFGFHSTFRAYTEDRENT